MVELVVLDAEDHDGRAMGMTPVVPPWLLQMLLGKLPPLGMLLQLLRMQQDKRKPEAMNSSMLLLLLLPLPQLLRWQQQQQHALM